MVEKMTPTLVLLPGMDGTSRLQGRFRACLRERCPVSAVAYPADRLASRAELRQQVLDAIPSDRDHVLVAESFSGPLALEYAASGAAGLRALVLVASFAASPLPAWLHWLGVFAGVAGFRQPQILSKLLLVGRDASPETLRELEEALDGVRPEVLVDRLRQVFAVDVRDRLASIDVPVHYLRGHSDRLVGPRGLAQLVGRVLDLSSEVIDGPHLLLHTRPQECARAIGGFVDALPTPSARMPANDPSSP